MKAGISITTNIEEMMERLGADYRLGIRAGMTRTVEVVEANFVKEEPIVTSNMVNSTVSEVSPDGKRGRVVVGAPYAEYVTRGTGIYGPEKRPIKPKNKKALYWSGARHPVKSVKGQRPNPFDERAIEKTDVQKEFETGMGDFLKAKGW